MDAKPTTRRGDVADLVPAVLVFMQLAMGVCFVAWWCVRALGHAGRAPEPAPPAVDAGRAPEPAPPAVDAGRAPEPAPRAVGAAPTQRDPGAVELRRRPVRQAAESPRRQRPLSPRQERGTRPQRAVPRVPAERPARDAGPHRPPGTGTPTRRDRDYSRHRANADRASSSPAASEASPQPGGTFLPTDVQARRADERDVEVSFVEAVDDFIIKMNLMNFRAREREGWIQDPRGPVPKPTPSALRAQRVNARLSISMTTE